MLPLKFFVLTLSIVMNTLIGLLQESNSDDELDDRQVFEDEAEESDNDFIDDDEPDESDSDAEAMTRSACKALRNRQTFRETNSGCQLCQDMRVVMRHLLGLE